MKQPFGSLVALTAVVALTWADMQAVQAQVSAETLKSISTADEVQTPVGKLEFFDGVPTDATVDKLYDNLDRMRAVEAFLDNVGALSVYSVIAASISATQV